MKTNKRVTNTKETMPFQQGCLDSLCGIYSLINAENLINNTKADESQKLFIEMIEKLNKEEVLASILTNGMLLKHLKALLNDVIGNRIDNKELRYCGLPNPTLDNFWKEISTFLNDSESPRAVILCLGGVHDHWTIIKGISEKQIRLFDSSNLKLINRKSCTTGNATSGRKHVLRPAQTYFLSNDKISDN